MMHCLGSPLSRANQGLVVTWVYASTYNAPLYLARKIATYFEAKLDIQSAHPCISLLIEEAIARLLD